MITIKKITSLVVLPILMISFSQCSSQKKLQKKAPMQFDGVYCQSWVAGIKGGGSGINIFIPAKAVSESEVILDSVYFRGKSSKLETKLENKTLYIGRFTTEFNKKKDLVMHKDAKQEYGNEMPVIPEKIPFELKENECVISYKKGNKTQYYKIENVVEKMAQQYPSAPQNKQ